jgi:hypothetical protein
MAVIKFVQNYDDLSTDRGYQFRFRCDHCGNGYESTYQANGLSVAGDLLRAAGGMLGGIFGSVGNSTYDIQRAVGGPQHDKALQNAVNEISPLFNQCRRCGQWRCKDVCWNDKKGLCKSCAPFLAEEIASAQATAARDQVYTKAQETDQTQGVNMAVQATATCPHCAAPSGPGKFCAECGGVLAATLKCVSCSAEIPSSAKFCPECGSRPRG